MAGGIGIWLYDAQTGEELNLFIGHTNKNDIAQDISFNPDGQLLASGGYDTIRLWNVSIGTILYIIPNYPDL